MEQEVIITNHNLLFHFSEWPQYEDAAYVFTHESSYRLVLERDQKRDQAKSLPSNSIWIYFLSIFNLSKRNLRYLLEFSRINGFPFSIVMEAPPHVHT